MEKDGPKTPGAFRLLFSHKPLEDISGPTDADMRSPQPGNDVSKSTSNTTKSRPNRRRPVARSPGRNFAIKLPNILYFAHHAIDKAKYPKKVIKPLIVLNRPIFENPSNFDWEDSEDSGSIMTDMFEDDLDVQATIEADTSGHDKPPRIEGGRPAMPRRISETLDADDATIVRMKQERRTDKEIADALVEAGGTKYSYKTIGTRWRRLRTVLATARDRKLDQGIIEWSTDDDSALLRAIKAADEDVSRMKANVEDMRWKLVATHLREIKTDALFSTKACYERAAALENVTATVPLEVDADPSKRKATLAATEKDNASYDGDHEPCFGEGVQPFTATTFHPERPTANAPPALAPITSLSYEAQLVMAGNMAAGLNNSIPLKDVHEMTRDEMREELRNRGLVYRGVKEVLTQKVLAARAGIKGLKPSPRMLTSIKPRPLPNKRPHVDVPHYPHQAISVSPTAVHDPLHKRVKPTSFETNPYADASTSNSHITLLSSAPAYQNHAITANSTPGLIGRLTIDDCAGFIYRYGDLSTLDPYQEPVSSGRRLFLYGFHDTMTTDLISDLLRKYSVKAIYPLGLPGHFAADCTDVVNAVEATEALNGKIYSGRIMIVRNAHEVAQSFHAAQTQQASMYTLPSQRITPAREFGDNATNCRLRVTNVPASMAAEDLMKMLANAQKCEPIGPGSFIVHFPSASSADVIRVALQGLRICGQAIDFEIIEDEAPDPMFLY